MNLKKVIENDYEEILYKEKTEEVIKYLKTFGYATFFEIVRFVGGSERRMLRLLNEMVVDKIINFKDNEFYINEKGVQKKYICNTCKGKLVYLEDDEIKDLLKEIWKQKPIPTLIFDQRPVTLDTTINRVLYLLSKNDVENSEIVFLGDDDLTSIALALFNKDCNITVLDVDQRLIDFINNISQKYNLNINAIVFDVTNDVPNNLKNKFDVLMTDPTPEKIPFTIFMNTAINLLKESAVLYTSIYSSAMEKNMDLQRIITDMNLYITEIIPYFTEYQSIKELFTNDDLKLLEKYNIELNENSICFNESLFRMIKTKNTNTIEIEYKLSDIFGKATKRVIKDRNNDIVKNEYIETIIDRYTKNDDETKVSK